MTGEQKPWFGPKRVGVGLRPQTWQGWALVLVPLVGITSVLLGTAH